jgi:hypothetical protein
VPELCLEDLQSYDPEGVRRFRCPLCESRSRCLGVELESGFWHCFRCGGKGRFGEYSTPGFVPPPAPKKRNDWRRLWNESQPIREGVTWRGISQWGSVRYNPDFYGAPCVIFPSVSWCASLTGSQGRKVGRWSGSKTLTARGSQLGLFATSALSWLNDPLILCEGPMDALSLEEIGYPAMATFGVQLPKWINRLTWWRRVAIATDADEAGDVAAERWRRQISVTRGFQRLRPQRGKDFNEWLQADRDGLQRYLGYEIFQHNGNPEVFTKFLGTGKDFGCRRAF